MSSLISSLAGAPQAASTTQGFYNQALQNDINAAGSPAAADFARLQAAQLRPEFNTAATNLSDSLAAQGITRSGAANSNYGNLASNEASALAGVTAPLYQEALGNYGWVNAQMPGAESQAYQDAINNFYQGIGGAASLAGEFFGLPSLGGGGSIGFNNPQQVGSGANAAYYTNTNPYQAGY